MLLRKSLALSVMSILFCASTALAQAPAIVVDAQQTIGSNYDHPQSVAVSPNGTVYVADTNNDQVVALIPNLPGASAQSTVNTGAYVLSLPQALAVDAAGDLFIGDAPLLGITGRVIEVIADSNGVLTNTVKQIYQGSLLLQPVSLAVDSANTLFIGDSELFGTGAIYSVPAGGKTPHKVKITGLPSGFTPAALVRDSSNNLYFVNSASVNGGIYVAPATGGAAQPIATGSFVIRQPTGLALDSSGDLFILSLLGSGSGFNAGQQVIEIPSASPATPYIIPTTDIETSSGMALDPSGNLDVAEIGSGLNGFGLVAQLNFLNPVDLGPVNVFNTGTAVLFNFEFNAPTTLSGFRTVTVGDLASKNSDVVKGSIGNCKNVTLPGATSAYLPYGCYQTFTATPQYTGTRVSAIQIQGSGAAILNSSPVYETGLSGAQITYPLDVTKTATGLIQPQGLAISGFDQTVYVADLGSGLVYSTSGLNGSSLKPVSTGSIPLQAPSAVAMNGEGDLFIADFNLGEVVVVPTTTGKAPHILNTGNLLQHPISLAVDFLGDLYIGDSGSDGDGATSSNPGYVVEVPYNGPALKVATPSVSIVFPQALATDSINGNLLIGDGGDVSTGMGQIVKVSAYGASVVSITGAAQPTDPTGLTFDAAENLYVLDGEAGTITVVPPTGDSQLLDFTNTYLASPSALANSAGSQSFVVANVGNGINNSLVYLNGNSSTFAFGNVAVGDHSATQIATVHNIGNETLTLSTPDHSRSPNVTGFDIMGSTTCAGHENLAPSTSCSFGFQFRPVIAGPLSQQMIINSNAYNSGAPLINLSGNGTGVTANFQAAPKLNAQVLQPRLLTTAPHGRKSFHGAGRRGPAR
jgi:sugar lactone lactonase YvrE